MSVITIFSGLFCREDEYIKRLLSKTGYRLVNDNEVVERASALSGISKDKIEASFGEKTSIFNKFTHEKERSISWLRQAVAEILETDKLIINGASSHLIPKSISHVLRICIIADSNFRKEQAEKAEGISKNESLQQIRKSDHQLAYWTNYLFKISDPWDNSLYDIVIPSDKMGIEDGVKLIEENLRSEVIRPTESSLRAVKDFILASRVGIDLAKEGHNVEVSARDGAVTITINSNVLLLNKLEEELKKIAEKVEGVRTVDTRIGKGFYQTDIYRKYEFDMPKLLLVDDEREFVHTLSERLLMRDVHSAVAYDGESALEILNEDDPDVIILDLKMPGIDGIEVLRKTKERNPETEVIILTGHGSKEDEETCMKLGAFAYLRKPVDIDLLTDMLKKAKEKMNSSGKGKN